MCYETKRKNKQKDLRKSFGLEDQESRKNTKQQKTKTQELQSTHY